MTATDPRDEDDERIVRRLQQNAKELLLEADRIRAEIVRRQFARRRASLGSPSPPPFNEAAEKEAT